MNQADKEDKNKAAELSRKVPKIPGIVYEGMNNNQIAAMLFLLSCFTLMIIDRSSLVILIPVTLLCMSVYSWLFSAPRPNRIFMTTEDFIAEYGFGKTMRDKLTHYTLHITTQPESAVKNYKYCVSLKPTDSARLIKRRMSDALGMPTNIPLQGGLSNPEALKSYVDALQAQLKQPLRLTFDTDKIFHEYRTGEFITEDISLT